MRSVRLQYTLSGKASFVAFRTRLARGVYEGGFEGQIPILFFMEILK